MAVRHPWFIAVALAVMAAMEALDATPGSAQTASELAECRTLLDSAAKLKCYENLKPPDVGLPASGNLSPAPQNIGRWRLLRTPNPRGGKDAISILRTGELSASDPDFAGLMVRCGDADLEVLLVLVKALPFRSHPHVVIGGTSYEATVAPPGSTVLLPPEAGIVARQTWPSLRKLPIEITNGDTATKGLILLDDLEPALQALDAACTLRQQ